MSSSWSFRTTGRDSVRVEMTRPPRTPLASFGSFAFEFFSVDLSFGMVSVSLYWKCCVHRHTCAIRGASSQ